MSERQEKILGAIIEEYIADASPVGSKTLSQRHDLGIGPAMIRQEMAELEGDDWLAQPHTSAGRIPTDKAYRFYISKNLEEKKSSLSKDEKKQVNSAVGSISKERDLLREVSRVASTISQELSVAGLADRDAFFTHGFAHLASEPEFQDSASLLSLMKFMDDMDDYFYSLWRNMSRKNLRVFIGEENPSRATREFTVIAGRYNLGRGKAGFVSLVGPRRMNYKKNMALVDYITNAIENLN